MPLRQPNRLNGHGTNRSRQNIASSLVPDAFTAPVSVTALPIALGVYQLTSLHCRQKSKDRLIPRLTGYVFITFRHDETSYRIIILSITPFPVEIGP
ncbi:hypothetical protein AVEN_226653-1 [Araneus ventricosus]|uniref:Uncharacterized protein n=1 Tax=Araneus ventricosus TaxID=182803 RepID=A0A4Y2J5N5_ARAVE|nr:hypothetical protein AVEN_226653-1 [Araneus ventricosus]